MRRLLSQKSGLRLQVVTTIVLAASLFCTAFAYGGVSEYPLRPFYPSVATLDTKALQAIYADAVIVDVRTSFEFNVIRIAKGVHIPLAGGSLVSSLARYRSVKSTTPLVFYCNDAACSRAFRAAMSAQANGYNNVYVYDSGVFAWLEQDAERTVLMGNSPARPKQVVPIEAFHGHQCDYEEFVRRSTRPATVIIDIRNIYDRARLPRLFGIKSIPMESFMEAVTNRVWAEKKLLIFDARGQQTRWLQFFLQANGYLDYTFLAGGVEGLRIGSQSNASKLDISNVSINQQELLNFSADDSLTPFDHRVFHLLLGCIRFENYAVVDRQQAALLLGSREDELLQSVMRLKKRGYILFSTDEDMLVAHLVPRLVWKGEMAGDLWQSRVREFDGSRGQ